MVASLFQTIFPERGVTSLFRDLALALAGSILLALSAQARIEVGPVPITLQTFVLFAAAIGFGWRAAGLMVLMYWAQGLAGLPVFAGAPYATAAVFLGPTGGFLVGFLPAALLTGWLANRGWDRNMFTAFAAMLLGTLVLYAVGAPYFALLAQTSSAAWGSGLGWSGTWNWAIQPFLVGDLVKMVLVALIFPGAWALVKRS